MSSAEGVVSGVLVLAKEGRLPGGCGKGERVVLEVGGEEEGSSVALPCVEGAHGDDSEREVYNICEREMSTSGGRGW